MEYLVVHGIRLRCEDDGMHEAYTRGKHNLVEQQEKWHQRQHAVNERATLMRIVIVTAMMTLARVPTKQTFASKNGGIFGRS